MSFIEKKLGIQIPKKDISKYLNSLEFETTWKGDQLTLIIPSFRSKDVLAEDDIVEEIARIYGYHNFPSQIMTGPIPSDPPQPDFAFETNVKNILTGLGATEVYSLSLVSKEDVGENALKLKNPLGTDTEYLRTSLMPSLISAAKNNVGTTDAFHLFEISNVYLPQKNNLPEERQMLAGIFTGYVYRAAKGEIEALLQKLNIEHDFQANDTKGFSANKVASIKSQGKEIGTIGITDDDFVYYELQITSLMNLTKPAKYNEISKFPDQVEDITFILPEKTRVGEVAKTIELVSGVGKCELSSIFEDKSYTFRVRYRNPDKTLTNEEVEKIMKQIISSVKSKSGGMVKD